MDRKRTILIADDSEINRRILCKILSEEYDVISAENGKAALELLQEEKENVAAFVLDLVMPVMGGFDVLEQMQKDETLSKIPVIIATQQEGEETEVKALSLGAADFLTKPYKPTIIKHRLANIIKLRETAAFINTVEKDPLTGVYNKEFFYRKAAEWMGSNPNQTYDLICADVERFKLVNDLFGNQVGDQLLEYIGHLFSENLHNEGICGRLGADTFAILSPHREDYTKEMFVYVIKKLNEFPIRLNLMMRFGIYTVEDREIAVSIMCDRAKLAVASIKGKYDVYFAYYDNSIREKLLQEQSITDGMKAGLEQKQFQVYFQPKYDLMTGNIAGAEALVRWIHPEKGFMSPGDFIPLFEKNGFITDLDFYVWENTCRQIKEWLDEGHEIPSISVNVSRADIYNPNLPQIIFGLVEKYGLSPKHLHLEITESAYTENPKQLIAVVSQLKNLGFAIEMDDFGTGYSSLNMLSELPIDILKLDMRFIQNESGKNSGKNILSFIISLAKWLDLLVVAEGVETQEQVEMLRNMDCNYVQGYYYARPLEKKAFEELLFHSVVGDMGKREETALATKERFPAERKGKTTGLEMVIVDDVAVNHAILAEIFKDQYVTVEKENGMEALSYIMEHWDNIGIVLLDLMMPVMDGFQLLERLKRDEKTREIPVIITSQAGENSEARALMMGASDFIAKPYHADVAIRRVENVMADAKVKSLEKEKELVAAVLEMKHRAERDALTGLYNRGELQLRVEHFFAENQMEKATFVMLDLDDFKNVNDTLGHGKGDEVLCRVAEILVSCFRQEDIITRMGGDEFAVFVPAELSLSDLKRRMEKICEKMVFRIDGIELSCSVGVCQSPQFGMDYQTLYENADKALLSAKRLGKNRYQIFGTEMDIPVAINSADISWLLNEIDDRIIVCDAQNYDVLYMNQAGCRAVGKTLRECKGKKCYEIMWGRDTVCQQCIKKEALTGEMVTYPFKDENLEKSYTLRAKQLKWNGKMARISCLHDNTQQILEKEKLETVKEELQLLMDAMPVGIFRYEAEGDGAFDFVCSHMLRMLGYTKDEFLEKFHNSFENMIYEEDRERVLQEIEEQIQTKETDNCRYRIETKSGELRWFHDVGHLVTDKNGKKWFYVVLTDITEYVTE